MNILALKAAADEFYRGTELEGNAGRTVRRILEQRLLAKEDGTASASLPVDTNVVGLAFAYIVDRLQQRMLTLEPELAELPGPKVTFSVTSIEPARGSFGVKIDVSSIPASMRERQALLAKLHSGLDSIMSNLSRGQCSSREVLANIFGEDTSPDGEKHARYARQFEALLKNEFNDIGRTPSVLCTLAGILNPAVIEADAKVEAAYAQEDSQLTSQAQQ